ncbi:MAG: anaerobic sulfatase maturase [Chloroflexota bacterium]|nr:anaerobic sulfatase maturase [Chloroflexota bacterium]MDE3103389.1 anaerobic sulfatase maturase [Chloroflexota bacterium]
MDPFLVMAKAPGPLCNLDCGYCYYLSKRDLFPGATAFAMTDEVLERYVRSYIAASPGPTVEFVWHGGEPTLRGLPFYRRAVELQRRHLPDGWTCANDLQTNGTFIDDEWARFFAEEHFAVGLSLDGPADVHDVYRRDKGGHATHRRVMNALRVLREHGVDPDILCTLNAATAARPREVYRFFLDNDVRWLQFLPVVQRAPDRGVSEASVSSRAFGEFLCTVFDEWVRHDVGHVGVQNFLECLFVWSGHSANICIMSEVCGNVVAMEHDGSVYSCDHFVDPAHRLGSVMTDDLGALVRSPAQLAFGAAKRDALPRQCRECAVRPLCNGGCPKDRFVAAADGDGGLNYLCEGYRAFYEHTAPYMKRMAELARAGRKVAVLMDELREREAGEEVRWQAASRNDPCPCGSGKKYKRCCLPTRRPR